MVGEIYELEEVEMLLHVYRHRLQDIDPGNFERLEIISLDHLFLVYRSLQSNTEPTKQNHPSILSSLQSLLTRNGLSLRYGGSPIQTNSFPMEK